MRKLPRTSERASNYEAVNAQYSGAEEHRPAHSNLPTKPDLPFAPLVENFDRLSHEEIYANIQQLKPTVLNAGGQAWEGAATGLSEGVELAHTEIRTAMRNGWHGVAAARADAAILLFEQAGQQLADVMSEVAGRLGQASEAAEAVRAAVPPPSPAQPNLAAALLSPAEATYYATAQKAAEGARLDVVQVMNSLYTGPFIQSGDGVPEFPRTPNPTTEAPTTAPVRRSITYPVGVEPVSLEHTSVDMPDIWSAPQGADGYSSIRTTTASVVGSTPFQPSTSAGEGHTAPSPTNPPLLPQMTPPPTGSAAIARLTAASSGPESSSAMHNVPAVDPTATSATGIDGLDKTKHDGTQRDSSSDAITGIGASTMGGLLSGAIVANDTPRSGAPLHTMSAARTPTPHALDDDLHYTDDALFYLEPADEPNELVGSFQPTTPPVLGEWVEQE